MLNQSFIIDDREYNYEDETPWSRSESEKLGPKDAKDAKDANDSSEDFGQFLEVDQMLFDDLEAKEVVNQNSRARPSPPKNSSSSFDLSNKENFGQRKKYDKLGSERSYNNTIGSERAYNNNLGPQRAKSNSITFKDIQNKYKKSSKSQQSQMIGIKSSYNANSEIFQTKGSGNDKNAKERRDDKKLKFKEKRNDSLEVFKRSNQFENSDKSNRFKKPKKHINPKRPRNRKRFKNPKPKKSNTPENFKKIKKNVVYVESNNKFLELAKKSNKVKYVLDESFEAPFEDSISEEEDYVRSRKRRKKKSKNSKKEQKRLKYK